ncbi:MAG: hypothetical protein ABTD50_01785 [Polyangiaceae bacterium]|jgi:hypothetical protein
MTDLAVVPIARRGFSLEPRIEGSAICLRLTGNADMTVVAPLTAAIKQVHVEAVRISANEVRCDLHGLFFMNSSCFKAFVLWITSVEALAPDKRYRIRLCSNPQLHWQKRSLIALQAMAESIVVVET